MDASQLRFQPKSIVIQSQKNTSKLKRFCGMLCPCLSSSNQPILSTRASFLSDEKQDPTQLREINSSVLAPTYPPYPIPTPISNPRLRSPPKFKSTFQKGSSPKKTHDLIPQRSSSEARSCNHPVMQFREEQLMTIGDSKTKMLVKFTSNRFIPSKQAIHKTQLIANKKQSSLFANPDFDEFSRSRYLFFEKFDQGIQIDKQSWPNLIPEVITEHIAARAKCTTILDGLCGVGSATIKFANTCHTVIANDPDQDKLYCFDNNVGVYGADNIIKHNKQFTDLKGINPDVIFLHPVVKNAQDIQLPSINPSTYFDPPLQTLLTKSFSMTNNVVMILPGNTQIEDLGIIYHNSLMYSQKQQTVSCSIQIQKIFFNKKLKHIIIYYGPAVNRSITMKEQLSFIYRILNEGKPTPFRYKNVVKHMRSRYGMVGLLDFTSECLKYEQESMMDRFFEMIRANELLSEKLLANLMSSPEVVLNKQYTFEEEKYEGSYVEEEYQGNTSDRTTSFVTDEGGNRPLIKDQLIRETIIINSTWKSQVQTHSSNFDSHSDASRGSMDRTKLHENI